jgi:hypothetical protein
MTTKIKFGSFYADIIKNMNTFKKRKDYIEMQVWINIDAKKNHHF